MSIVYGGPGPTMLATTPVVLNTWPFTAATDRAYAELLRPDRSALDAIEEGCNICEVAQCDFTVGYGGSPDSSGETTLDAMIMDGDDQAMGAVACLRRVKDAIRVARRVLTHSSHSLLAGDGALAFAKMMGFREESLTTPYSTKLYLEWQANRCQPNYYRNMINQSTACPPYTPASVDLARPVSESWIDATNHDTIGMVALSSAGHLASGTSSNGANHKIAGRVGDAPIPGAGSYADSTKGAAAATGDGDVMMRFLPTYQAVQDMGNGVHPQVACEMALRRIATKAPAFKGGIVCLNPAGVYGAAGFGWNFSYAVRTPGMEATHVISVDPIAVV
ncbi:N4-(beta-N-acetylglucosaminyl)-L-asparaginase [Saprolegnia diclina VS20]|uniref:N4-(Beta-N-acetylglucosaminyl)-L-asparaginase n=1 Tax=Saprolegnia diclina (strain VS20) TaxID=1156394 RepID=T0PVA5_SAPDV|nr:N4-(beta-N-acetylglucosaminyl)-L-asparaginase [Saprolegnia diclina VS20]EQC29429.1 N4-(beta-N-acetylglucosaminyl)-L-asparaginase [Saprolegnia diclina VS20]|eukprot:XP_008617196.1 N4-(beta-N-acetylglucosaminyl)-L-asparaginase [Saprolegnia diclina VS20]